MGVFTSWRLLIKYAELHEFVILHNKSDANKIEASVVLSYENNWARKSQQVLFTKADIITT